MKRLSPLLLPIVLALGCSRQEEPGPTGDHGRPAESAANTQQADSPDGRKPPEVSPKDPTNDPSPMYGLPLVIEYELPAVPEEIIGPFPELPDD